MEQITKIDRRKGALKDVGDAYSSISSLINNLTSEQKKTVITMRKLEALMIADRGPPVWWVIC